MLSRMFGAHRKEDDDSLVDMKFVMPAEDEPHEGTWLQWPHNHGSTAYDRNRQRLERYEESWIQMTMALHVGEIVHIIVYDPTALNRVKSQLTQRNCNMKQIDFHVWPTDDVWVRDNGPVFVLEQGLEKDDTCVVTDWGFNGWGSKSDYEKDNEIPRKVANALGLKHLTVPMVNEGGSIEIDGHGTLMAKRSSILNKNRNEGWSQEDAEHYFTKYLGVTNFIWLTGTKGLDITDDHIDGTARFACGDTIVTMAREDFEDPKEYDILSRATNLQGKKYNLVHVPLTTRKIVEAGDYGSYVNFYVGNKAVLVPSYNDPNDAVAVQIFQTLYPGKQIVSIPMATVLKDGGMIHCVTQQQPMAGPAFTMPAEEEPHEGTWLQWPHNEGSTKYDRNRKRLERYEESWIQMTLALHTGERVHIVVYDQSALERVRGILSKRGCDMTKIDLYAWPTNDVWVRDNGPVFVYDSKNDLHITDWAFNGWGEKADFDLCNQIPRRVAQSLDLPMTTIPMVNEGGSVEVDGHGTLMAKRSSILNKNRNKGWTQDDVEAYFYRYLGVTNFIWLDGTKRADITDDHIDGTARFACGDTIVTLAREDFLERKEYDILANAKNVNGKKYKLVHLPLTAKKVSKGEHGVYCNFYVGNKMVLMPTYDDPNDTVAIEILQKLYNPTGRKVVGVPMSEVVKDGGMVHCVTQQQPAAR